MNSSYKQILFSLLLLPLLSCGGGSGGSNVPFFGGVWSGSLRLVEDSCDIGLPSFAFFNHLVNQDEFQIVLDNGAVNFTGTIQSDASFSVENERAFRSLFPSANCTETLTWRYEAIDLSNEKVDFVVRRSEISCVSGSSEQICSIAFSGSGRRGTRDVFGPIPLTAPEELEVPAGAVNAADL